MIKIKGYKCLNLIVEVSQEYSNRVNDQRRYVFFYTLINTGMRYGELVGLKWKDINLFVKYGMISEEKFYDKVEKIALFESTDSKMRTIEEYKKILQWTC